MSKENPPLVLAYTALRELGLRKVGLYSLYQIGLRTGWIQRRTRQTAYSRWPVAIEQWGPLPDAAYLRRLLDGQLETLLAEADSIAAGRVTIFGQVETDLEAVPPASLRHWSRFGSARLNGRDIKFCWEPARFGWVFTLGRAYHLSAEERYPEAFWKYLQVFLLANPPNLGPNWVSAQEIGIRLLALIFAARIFAGSPHSTRQQIQALGGAIAAQARRIPVTLAYARAQDNNHLLTEAAALYSAGLFLPDHPQAPRWRKMGWKWLHRGLQSQIAPDGTYMQQSTNYHRLMLQTALWALRLARQAGQPFPRKSRLRLAAATNWLLALTDPQTGRVPNLGANDGAYLFPATVCPYEDYRPVLQAASLAFLGAPAFAPGPWDEMSEWFRVGGPQPKAEVLKGRAGARHAGLEGRDLHPPAWEKPGEFPGEGLAASMPPAKEDRRRSTRTASREPSPSPGLPLIIRHGSLASHAYLRAARFNHRPGHADQLHVDLWWQGLNIALDPGTYLYNARPPWQNALASAFHHNTLTINGQDQMTPAGRFLYVDWAQARLLERTSASITAEHDGYERKLGLIHRRALGAVDGGWRVRDSVLPAGRSKRLRFQGSPSPDPLFSICVHWLLPDWSWRLEDDILQVRSPRGWVRLAVSCPSIAASDVRLVRAGERLHGSGSARPTHGWFSPTYGIKEPALSFAIVFRGRVPCEIDSSWSLL